MELKLKQQFLLDEIMGLLQLFQRTIGNHFYKKEMHCHIPDHIPHIPGTG